MNTRKVTGMKMLSEGERLVHMHYVLRSAQRMRRFEQMRDLPPSLLEREREIMDIRLELLLGSGYLN